jgi:hypothetical protein
MSGSVFPVPRVPNAMRAVYPVTYSCDVTGAYVRGPASLGVDVALLRTHGRRPFGRAVGQADDELLLRLLRTRASAISLVRAAHELSSTSWTGACRCREP